MKIERSYLLLMSVILYLLGILYGQSRMIKKMKKTQKKRAAKRSNAPNYGEDLFK